MTDGRKDGQAVMLFFTAAAAAAAPVRESSRSANPHTFSISFAAITRLLFLTPSSHSVLRLPPSRVGNLDKYTRVRHDEEEGGGMEEGGIAE